MKILIAIHGAHSQPEQMAAQRETWLADLAGVDYRYFLGIPESVHDVAFGGDIEHLKTLDGPLWEGHRRTLNANRKTEALAKYALDGGYDYVFKCDDDTYVYVDRLLASGFEQFDYSGSMDRHHATPMGWYSWAQGGAGYWLSRTAMQIIVSEGLHLVRAEDFAVGQILAAHGIEAHLDARYIPAAHARETCTTQPLLSPDGKFGRCEGCGFNLSEVITLHKVSPGWMRAIHNSKGETQWP